MAAATNILSPLEILDTASNRIEINVMHNVVSNAGYRLPLFHSLNATGAYGTMDFFCFASDDYSIWYSEYKMVEKTHFTSRADVPVLELSIPFKKQFDSNWDGKIRNGGREKQLQMLWLPHINSKSVFDAAGVYATFDVHYTKEYLQRFAPQFPVLDIFLEKVEREEPCMLNAEPGMLSPAMLRCIHDVLHCDLPATLASYQYESAVLMLLLRVLDNAKEVGKQTIKLSAYDIECLREAEMLISEDMATRYSIYELAQLTGMSETKLQHSFKQEYGTTLFDYAQNLRLDYAKRLLLDTKDSIQSIALQCGYPDHPNFSIAFKKRFGYTPEWFRGGRK